jgi:DNA (cytosine-5)-methyltransferase 1
MRVIDLFCGAGGLSLGFERAGFTIVAGFDLDVVACETFRANLLADAFFGDLKDVDALRYFDDRRIQRVDVIVGGPPCTGFSRAGIAKVRHLGGQTAELIERQNTLYRQFVRFVRDLQPLMFVMENVPHLGNYRDGLIALQIKTDFRDAGYNVYDPLLLDALDYGVPQMRRRLFFVGTRKDVGWAFRPPRPTHGDATGIPVRTLADAIADLPARQAPSWDEEILYAPREISQIEEKLGWSLDREYALLMRSRMPEGLEDRLWDHIVRDVREDDRVIFASMKPGGTYKDVDPQYRRYAIKRGANGDLHFADRYYRLSWARPCVTITAHMAKDGYRYIYPDDEQIRTLSVREAARIQSFPDQFRFAGHRSNRFRQIGNAVPPLLAQRIAERVAEVIRGYRNNDLRPHEFQPELPGFEDLVPSTRDLSIAV